MVVRSTAGGSAETCPVWAPPERHAQGLGGLPAVRTVTHRWTQATPARPDEPVLPARPSPTPTARCSSPACEQRLAAAARREQGRSEPRPQRPQCCKTARNQPGGLPPAIAGPMPVRSGSGPGPRWGWMGVDERQPIHVSLPLLPPPFPSLSEKKRQLIKKKKSKPMKTTKCKRI